MKIGKFCKRNAVIAKANTNVLTAAKWMRDSGARAVVVVDDQRTSAVGIVSLETLVWEVMAAEGNPAETPLSDVMTDEFTTVKDSDNVFDTVRLMFENGLERVVVVDEDGCLGGLVTLEELFAELTMELIEFSTVEEHAVEGIDPERAGLPERPTAMVRETIGAVKSSPAVGKESLDQEPLATHH